MKAVRLEKVEKTYPDGTRAVRGIDLALEAGEFVVLLGPSGCGKTTTLRMIAGLELPTAGSIRLGETEVTALRPSQRDVGFVFQFYALYPHMTVRENLAFPLEASGVARAEIARRVDEVARHLGLEELLPRRPRQLSGGDQQRVALGRAMIRRPAVWLMDEPLGTLDADLRLAMCEFLRARQLEERVTTVYVTHDQEEALRLADRIVVMSQGTILQAASAAEVYDRPADLFVARFVGSPGMNFLAGEARGARVRCGAQEFELARELPAGAVTLGIRPEAVALVVALEGASALRGRVAVDEYLGSSRCLHVDTPLGRIVARVAPEARAARGEEVGLALDCAHLLAFDAGSGRLLA